MIAAHGPGGRSPSDPLSDPIVCFPNRVKEWDQSSGGRDLFFAALGPEDEVMRTEASFLRLAAAVSK